MSGATSEPHHSINCNQQLLLGLAKVLIRKYFYFRYSLTVLIAINRHFLGSLKPLITINTSFYAPLRLLNAINGYFYVLLELLIQVSLSIKCKRQRRGHFSVGTGILCIVRKKWFENILLPYTRWIKDLFSISV